MVIDQTILDALEHYPFSYIRELARPICILLTLNAITWLVVKHLCEVPHTLTPTQKPERATLSIELLHRLQSIEHHGWQFIITRDESLFYLFTDHEQIWLRLEEQPAERPRYIIQDQKMMVSIAWNSLGSHLLDALPEGSTFDAEYYRVNILIELLRLRS
jgi:hypothetical protein